MATQPVTWFLVYPGNQQQVIQPSQQQQMQQQLQQQHQQQLQQQLHLQVQYQQSHQQPQQPHQQQQPCPQQQQQKPSKQQPKRVRKKPTQQPQKQDKHQQSMPPKNTCRQSHQENNSDWVCILCHKICHYRCLGDLFGPYIIDFSSSNEASSTNNSNKKTSSGQKSDEVGTSTKNPSATNSSSPNHVTNIGTGNASGSTAAPSIVTTPKVKRSRYSLLNHNIATSNNKKSSSREIWIHEDCLIWSDGVHIVGNKIRAMEEVIVDSLNHKCAACKTTGATIGCVGKRCRRKYHFVCAVNIHCLLDETSFTLTCVDCLIKKDKPIEPN